MTNCLYLVCPTDFLETTINKRFKGNNFFYSSLGNAVEFNESLIYELKSLIQKHHITSVRFVLSYNNKMVLDALNKQAYSDIAGMNSFYTELNKCKQRSKVSWNINNKQFCVLSYYLNAKVKQLQFKLANSVSQKLSIKAKVYNHKYKRFTKAYSNLICLEKHQLN